MSEIRCGENGTAGGDPQSTEVLLRNRGSGSTGDTTNAVAILKWILTVANVGRMHLFLYKLDKGKRSSQHWQYSKAEDVVDKVGDLTTS